MELNLLLTSDQHCKFEYLEKLPSDLVFDIALCSGDFCNLKGAEYNDAQACTEAETQIAQFLQHLEKRCKQVYFIPGNHDPISMFTVNNHLQCEVAKNVHNSCIQIAPNLTLAGFGGSIPAYFAKSLQKRWEGYPYNSEQEYEKDFAPFLQQVLQVEHQILLMVHNGPQGSDTCKYHLSPMDEPIESGSLTVKLALQKQVMQDKVCATIHGHTHPGRGMQTLCQVPIINPGSLKEGNWAHVTLATNAQGKWFVKAARFLHFE